MPLSQATSSASVKVPPPHSEPSGLRALRSRILDPMARRLERSTQGIGSRADGNIPAAGAPRNRTHSQELQALEHLYRARARQPGTAYKDLMGSHATFVSTANAFLSSVETLKRTDPARDPRGFAQQLKLAADAYDAHLGACKAQLAVPTDTVRETYESLGHTLAGQGSARFVSLSVDELKTLRASFNRLGAAEGAKAANKALRIAQRGGKAPKRAAQPRQTLAQFEQGLRARAQAGVVPAAAPQMAKAAKQQTAAVARPTEQDPLSQERDLGTMVPPAKPQSNLAAACGTTVTSTPSPAAQESPYAGARMDLPVSGDSFKPSRARALSGFKNFAQFALDGIAEASGAAAAEKPEVFSPGTRRNFLTAMNYWYDYRSSLSPKERPDGDAVEMQTWLWNKFKAELDGARIKLEDWPAGDLVMLKTMFTKAGLLWGIRATDSAIKQQK